MLSDPARCARPLAAAALILAVVAAACSADDPTAAPVTGATTTTSTIASGDVAALSLSLLDEVVRKVQADKNHAHTIRTARTS
ncbi:MAG: hypothetical protein OXC06_06925 [Acidimicrobiaceae bacterium]|nr:hypothetical protein [Acidimicrobiaceae bacterium]